jgi:SAM-dependent methyltransferase
VNSDHQRLCTSPEWAAHLQNNVLPALLSGVELGERLLEFGPGPGAATEWLRLRVGQLTAVEVDPDAADSLATRFAHDNVEVIVGDCARTPFADESFDSVASLTMLHHLATAHAQHQVLAEAFRVLRPGGVLLGSDSIASDELHQFHAEDTYNPIDPTRLLLELQILSFVRINLVVGDELTFTARKPLPLSTQKG